jgi:uncharacterized protein
VNEKLIFDTGFLYACFDIRDDYHFDCKQLMATVLPNALLPDVVLPELSYLILKRLDVKILVEFLRNVANGSFELVRTTEADLERAAEILEKYNDNNIDLVDACIVAIAERLEIKKILTVDRRHFGVFKPKHCASFTLLPE